MSEIKAEAHWEVGDVYVQINGTSDKQLGDVIIVPHESLRHNRSEPNMCKFSHGYVLNASFTLTVSQAESLAQQLLNAAQEMRRMDQKCKEDLASLSK